MSFPLAFLIIMISFSQSSALSGYATYHDYSASTPLTECACSDGKNGLMTRWGISDISSLYPYVTSFSMASWNSPYCGNCLKLSYNGKSIFVTVIDACGNPPAGLDAHFDMSPEAYQELGASVAAGHSIIKYNFVTPNHCKGNKGYF